MNALYNTSVSSSRLGAAMVTAAAIGFSTKAIFIKLAYPYGISPVTLMTLRMIFSLPIYAVIAYFAARRAHHTLTPADWLKTALLGGCGYYVASFLDFEGLRHVSASVERLVLYSYPSIILALNAILFRQRPSIRELLGLAVCYAGIALIVQTETARGIEQDHWLGIALVAASAFAYALFLVYSPKMLKRLGSTRYNAYGMCFATGFIVFHHQITTPLAETWSQPAPVFGFALGMAIFSTVIPSFLMMSGIARIGANRSGLLGMVGPASTIILAALFLGEKITFLQMVGTALVIAGVAFQEHAAQSRRN